MINKFFSLSIVTVMSLSSMLFSETQYEIQDIGTLQAYSSQPIAINNQGQILAWYNIDNTSTGKRYFLRDTDGVFHEIVNFNGWNIDWKYLTNNGKVYAKYNSNNKLCLWDQLNGATDLGTLPGSEISAINDLGQVLIKSVSGTDQAGRGINNPVIWLNGSITKLKGLEGDFGAEAQNSLGYGLNNSGQVVGQSTVETIYKNKMYHKGHAVFWPSKKAEDSHYKVPKSEQSFGKAINGNGDMIINADGIDYFVSKNGLQCTEMKGVVKKLNNNYILANDYIYELDVGPTTIRSLNQKVSEDANSIWLTIVRFEDVNENGQIVAIGKTIYGEEHVVLLTPVKAD